LAVIRSLCGQCCVGCGVRAVPREGRRIDIEGDRTHPANGGRLCAKGDLLAQTAQMDGRLLQPMIDGRPATWNRAVGQVARRLSETLARHGPGSIALHVGGGLLTEDYYVANKLMKGFIGSAHIDAPGGEADSIVAAQIAAFGEDVMPVSYEDVDRAALVLMIGADTARRHPVLHRRVLAARESKGTQVIAVTAGENPGHDAELLDRDYLSRSVVVPEGFWAGLRAGHDVWSVARACGIAPGAVRGFFDLFAAHARTVTLFGDSTGGNLAAALLNLHLATGRIGRAGVGPFALTRAANGMGGREVGCLASGLAAHMDFAPAAIARTARFWAAPAMAIGTGLHGEALMRAIGEGTVKALWVIGGVMDSSLKEAMTRASFTILSTDQLPSDQWPQADVALPSPVWIERDGTATGADRLISRQRPLLPLPGEAKPDWWAVTQVARAMGWREGFHYERPAEIYREHARLSAYENGGTRLFDLRRHASISNPAYDELTPWRWGDVPFDGGLFPTADGRA
jgi:assimilatory nitrate reductase catalytic subunit